MSAHKQTQGERKRTPEQHLVYTHRRFARAIRALTKSPTERRKQTANLRELEWKQAMRAFRQCEEQRKQ